MRIDVVGTPAVSGPDGVVAGAGLGGRRVQVALVALALERGDIPAERLAARIWPGERPSTWAVALRGVVRGLRASLAGIGAGGGLLVVTVANGYRLDPAAEVDVDLAERSLRRAADLAAAGRFRPALELAEPVGRLRGEHLLQGEDGDWLTPHRLAVDALGRRGLELVVGAASRLGDHGMAAAAARTLVATWPLDESAHRLLIEALVAAGDRAGAVRAFEECRSTLADELGVDPSTETVQTYLSALRDQAPTARAPVPRRTGTFVGRVDEFGRLADAIDAPGLVVLTGLGGVGKSRLATEVARAAGEFPGGRLWVSVEPVSQDTLVAATVALALGMPPGAVDASTAVADHLAPLGRTLLVLDGCERSTDGVESLVAELLVRCPMLTVLVTSRAPLGIVDGATIHLDPFPTDDAGGETNPVVRLLADRVREGGGELRLDDARVAQPVAELLRRCAGLPLAVELAAAQLAAMPVGDLVDQIDAVVGDDRDPLRAIARGSYEALDPNEAAVFRRLSILEGSVGLAFVRAVVSGEDVAPVRVVRILRELAAAGLVGVDRSGPRWRYRQDDDLHRFARELLAERGEERAAFDRLADAIRALLPDDAREPPAPYQEAVTDVLESVRSLFNGGLDGTADGDRCLELAFRLHRYWASTHVMEGRFWLSELLGRYPDAPWAAHATYALGYLDYWSGDTLRAIEELTSAVDRLQDRDDAYVARALIYLAGLLDDQDRGEEAIAYIRRAMAAARPLGTDLQVAAAMGLGSVLSERGDPEAARFALEAIDLCRRRGSSEQLAAALPTAATVCWQVGAVREAAELVDEARPLHTDSRRIARVVLLSVSAGLALDAGDAREAVDIGSLADEEGTDLGVEREMPLIRSVLARALLAAGDHAGAAARAEGAIRAALSMGFAYPLAIGLETAALVLRAFGGATDADLDLLLAAASGIRSDGDRPPPATLRADVDRLRTAVPATGAPSDASAAADLALRLLAFPVGVHERDGTRHR